MRVRVHVRVRRRRLIKGIIAPSLRADTHKAVCIDCLTGCDSSKVNDFLNSLAPSIRSCGQLVMFSINKEKSVKKKIIKKKKGQHANRGHSGKGAVCDVLVLICTRWFKILKISQTGRTGERSNALVAGCRSHQGQKFAPSACDQRVSGSLVSLTSR